MQRRRTKMPRYKASNKRRSSAEPRSLDKRDEVWCYLLIKLFTTMLEDSQEAQRLLGSSSKTNFDVDLEPAIRKLKEAIDRKKSDRFKTTSTTRKSSSHTTSGVSSEPRALSDDEDSSSENDLSTKTKESKEVDVKRILLSVLNQQNLSKCGSYISPQVGRTVNGEGQEVLNALMSSLTHQNY